MKKLYSFLLLFLLALFVFNSQAFACRSKPKIYSVVQDLETWELLISGKHLGNKCRVKLGDTKLEILEATHDEIRVKLPVDCVPGSYRLLLSRKIKRRWRWRYWASTHMDVTIAGSSLHGDPGSSGKVNPPAEDTTPPEIIDPTGPSPNPIEFLETYALISFDVKDDNEIAFIGIQNVALPSKSKTVYAPLDKKEWSVSEEIATKPGDNTVVIMASDIHGNIAQNAEIQFHRARDCQGCNLRGLYMREATFYGANLAGAVLSDSDLSGANLSGANLSKDEFGVKASLNGAHMSNANLYEANMDSALLAAADLTGADLRKATLTSAIMIGANLRGAELEDAVLSGANLANADLRGANLAGATMVGTRGLDWAIFGNTICPDGTNSDASGGNCLNNLDVP